MKKTTLFFALLLAFIGMAFTFGNDHNGYHIGDTARDFKLKNVDGSMVGLADAKKAEGYVVIFTCNHCPFSIAYEDRIIAIHKKYAKKGFPVIAINPNDKDVAPDDSFEKMQARAKEKKFAFSYLYDETQEIAKAYGATRTPHVFLLDKNRVVRYIGAIDDNSEEPDAVKEKYLENAIDALLAGKEIAVKETKAVGCTIKWSKKK